MVEEAAHPEKSALAFNDEPLVFRIKIRPWNILRNACLAREALQLGREAAIFRLGPWFNCTFGDGLRFIWNDQIQVKIDRVPEPLTTRASAVGVIKGKQARLRLLIANAAVLAFKALGESQALRCLSHAWCSFENHLSGLAIANLNSIHDSGPRIGRYHEAINEQEHGFGKVDVQQGFRSGELENLTFLIKPVESTGAQVQKAGF